MAEVQLETLKPDIADEIYVKFQQNRICFASNNILGRKVVSTGRRQDECTIKDGGLEPEVDMK